MKLRHLILFAVVGYIAYVLVKRRRNLENAVAQLQHDSTAKLEAVNNQYVTNQYVTQVVNPDAPTPSVPVKYIVVRILDGGNFDDYLTQQALESEDMDDCRIVRFLFESDNLSNYWLIRGIDAQMIAQFL
ncbi:hypothetical protein GCM10028806_19680 [Spirosoma terrae]|uniref:Uncharacterized protein n=1 Tax=Spirosoma terrae TaxID=1968276 RepID=A0A6L9L2E9_9BACT|nr:hypothetical protein [Spirosoma terrae]NDU94715.1 hypothetical protein [Spirosoma terrae]